MKLFCRLHWFLNLATVVLHQTTSPGPTAVTPEEEQVEQALNRMQITDTQMNTVTEAAAVQPMSPPQDTPQAPPQAWVTPTSPTAVATSPQSILPTPPPSVGSSPMTSTVQTEQNCTADQDTDAGMFYPETYCCISFELMCELNTISSIVAD